ncbi:MAG TPA: Gfo/Idh/MocA family oxidoreductase [Salinarimonas sp.]|jgi:predicted dehydrogenase|nr:Gfo/Idh/MocA family oxidoreductase [Salinarimonas sp.]
MTRLGIAVVGVGPAAQPHARSLIDLAGSIEVRRVVGRDPERLGEFARAHPFPVTTDLDAALADPGVAAVIVLTPPAAHLEVAGRCLAAGKHVLVEKPLDLTAERGERLVGMARAAGLRLGVVLQHRFRPGARRLAALLAERALGHVTAAWASVPWWRPQSYYDEPGRGTLARDGGGVLLTQAIHALDLFRSLVGVSEVRAADAATTLHRMETEDYAAALLRLGNGAPGFVHATTTAHPGGPERIEIAGSLGTARLVGGALDVSFHDGRAERVEAEGRTGAGANIMDFPHDAHRDLIADFAAAIREDRDPLVTGEEALETQALIEAILRSGRAS